MNAVAGAGESSDDSVRAWANEAYHRARHAKGRHQQGRQLCELPNCDGLKIVEMVELVDDWRVDLTRVIQMLDALRGGSSERWSIWWEDAVRAADTTTSDLNEDLWELVLLHVGHGGTDGEADTDAGVDELREAPDSAAHDTPEDSPDSLVQAPLNDVVEAIADICRRVRSIVGRDWNDPTASPVRRYDEGRKHMVDRFPTPFQTTRTVAALGIWSHMSVHRDFAGVVSIHDFRAELQRLAREELQRVLVESSAFDQHVTRTAHGSLLLLLEHSDTNERGELLQHILEGIAQSSSRQGGSRAQFLKVRDV